MPNDSYILSNTQIAELAAQIDRPIVLVGLMGVGKSTIGRKLSQVLNLPFFDADDEIVSAAKMPITEIFAQFGEASFRDGERRVISRLMERGPSILATGGGAFVQDETRELILEKGIAIWLDSELSTLVERVGRKDNRPLLRQGNPAEILARLKAEREPAYRQAPIHVTSDQGPYHVTVNQILQELQQWP